MGSDHFLFENCQINCGITAVCDKITNSVSVNNVISLMYRQCLLHHFFGKICSHFHLARAQSLEVQWVEGLWREA